MVSNVTRGGLVPAKITNLISNQEVKCLFNPEQYTITKTNTWEKKNVIGQNLPNVSFSQGGAQSLKLKLIFDSLEAGTDVRAYTDPLWNMMMIDSSTENAQSGKGTPPPVAFEWGGLYFKAIITTMSQRYTLFSEAGVPLRCEVDVTLEQFLDIVPAEQTGSSGGGSAPGGDTVRQGDRIDHVASRSTGDPNNQRAVAEQNNIDDPSRIPNGTTLSTPN